MIFRHPNKNTTLALLDARVTHLEERLSLQVADAVEKLHELSETVMRLADGSRGLEERIHASVSVMPWRDGAASISQLHESVRQGFGQIVQRLDRDLAGLVHTAEANSGLTGDLRDGVLQGFRQIVQRMDNDLAALGHKIEVTGGLSADLRDAMLQSFGQIVQRMETDFTTLAQSVQRLDGDVVALAKDMRDLGGKRTTAAPFIPAELGFEGGWDPTSHLETSAISP